VVVFIVPVHMHRNVHYLHCKTSFLMIRYDLAMVMASLLYGNLHVLYCGSIYSKATLFLATLLLLHLL